MTIGTQPTTPAVRVVEPQTTLTKLVSPSREQHSGTTGRDDGVHVAKFDDGLNF